MNNDINIAEILKDCPKGMRLYSPLLGNVTLEKVDTNSTVPIRVMDGFNSWCYFTKTGLYYDRADGECLLFPSSKMRDWTKFFKRGDVVHNKEGNVYAIFDGWVNDNYTEFNTTINYCDASFAMFFTKEVYYTNSFVKARNEEGAVFIANAKKYYNGRYNFDTLQVEPIKSKCESKYRPFKNKEECLEEMQKHHPFGWIKNEELLMNITSVGDGITVNTNIGDCGYSFKSAFSATFIDGTPFGIKEEE